MCYFGFHLNTVNPWRSGKEMGPVRPTILRFSAGNGQRLPKYLNSEALCQCNGVSP